MAARSLTMDLLCVCHSYCIFASIHSFGLFPSFSKKRDGYNIQLSVVCGSISLIVTSTVTTYSKTCLKRPLKKRPKIGFHERLSLNAGQKYCRMLQERSSTIVSTFSFFCHQLILQRGEVPKKTYTQFT